MTVTCQMNRCPYWYNGFCSKPVVNIDENGMCKQLWKRGSQNPYAFEPVESSMKRVPAIVEGDYYEQQSEEETDTEGPETNSKDSGTNNGECGPGVGAEDTREG